MVSTEQPAADPATQQPRGSEEPARPVGDSADNSADNSADTLPTTRSVALLTTRPALVLILRPVPIQLPREMRTPRTGSN